MNKFAKGKHRRSKREARQAVDQALRQQEQKQGNYQLPPSDEIMCDGPLVDAPSDTTRLYAYIFYNVAGEIAKFVFLHFVRLEERDDGWYNLARVDCSHGHVHLHEDDQGLSSPHVKHILKLDTIQDVANSFDSAYEVIFNEWKDREVKFRHEYRTTPRRRPTQRLPQGSAPGDCA